MCLITIWFNAYSIIALYWSSIFVKVFCIRGRFWFDLVAQIVKNPPAMLETWVQTLGWEDPLEEGMATPLFLPWECPQTEEPGGLQSIGCKELDITEQLNIAYFPQKANAISFPAPLPQFQDIITSLDRRKSSLTIFSLWILCK